VAIERIGAKGGLSYWRCRCDCGAETIVTLSNLQCGHVSSCGCYRREHMIAANKTHGGKGTRLYEVWHGMKYRCLNPKSKPYMNYGGRGITVCDSWINDFEAFRAWALSNGYNDNLTIERVNRNGNYEPSNCKWIPLSEQPKNRRPGNEWKNTRGIEPNTKQILAGRYRNRPRLISHGKQASGRFQSASKYV
jgi:hypothetical protein